MRPGERFAATGLLLLLISACPVDSSIQAFHRSYGPKADLLVSSPTLQWEVWPSDGSEVTSTTMLINGREVDATYNKRLRRLEYHPNRPFQAGAYKVECKVQVADRLEVKKNWAFQVSTDALASLPEPDSIQDRALNLTNSYRRTLGLADAYQEPRLNAASYAHVRYLVQNKRTGHYQKPGEPGFVGATPSDRIEAFGYCGNSWECVAYHSGGLEESIRDLFNAPYHRIPFLQPGKMAIGTGFIGKHYAMEFGSGDADGASFSPAAGQENVPTSWDGNESPNPLRMHQKSRSEVGYPIVFCYFDDNSPSLRNAKATLTLDGQEVPSYLNNRENDDVLENSVVLIPKLPLQPNKAYQVSVQAMINGKKEISRTWTFTTGQK